MTSLLVIRCSARSAVCRSWITDYSADASNLMLADLCSASDVELDTFFSEDRKHIKEGCNILLFELCIEFTDRHIAK